MGDFGHGDDKEPYYADFTKPKGCKHAQIIVSSVLVLCVGVDDGRKQQLQQ